MSDLSQRSFIGGMNLLGLDTDIDDTEYRLAINVRQRYGYLEAINKSVDITYNLRGKFQGLYAVGAIWLAFFSGNAYYMPVGGNIWIQVPFFSMDPFVDYIYAQAVTGSTNNLLRQAVVTGPQNLVDATAGIIKNNAFSVSGNPAGVVCQDGSNQPFLISYDSINNNAIARRLQTYDQWQNNSALANAREYVPVGTRMMYLDGVLYIVNGNIVYRSISGRPLDFMINVDQNGNKLATEALGGAQTMSFAQDFDDITSILPIGSGQFTISTARFIYGEQTDFSNTIFGEPQFTKIFQVEAGIVNQFSTSDKNGDRAFIDFEGVKFYNSVQQLKFEGSNDPLSKNINILLESNVATGVLSQNVCASIAFNNFNLFALNTRYGYSIAVYDNMKDKWVGFDVTEATTSGIKMFAEAVLPNERFIAAGNQLNKIWLLYADRSNRETAMLTPRAFVSGGYSNLGNFVPDGLYSEHKTNSFKVGIYCGKQDGEIRCIESVDNKISQRGTKDIEGFIQAFNYPIEPPVFGGSTRSLNNVVFPFNKGLKGYKIVPLIRWNSDCLIAKLELSTTSDTKTMSQQQQAKLLSS